MWIFPRNNNNEKTPMRRVALFSTYCDTEEKEKALLDNLIKVKSLGLDSFVLTILPLSKKIHDAADYVIYSKENPIPDINTKSIVSWRICENNVKLISFLPDYGYPSLLQLKRLIDFSSTLDYDYYFTMIYDIIITPEIEKVLTEGRECSFFKNSKVDEVLGGILTAFNGENAKKFSSLLTEKSYYKDSHIAEAWMAKVNDLIGGTIEDIYASDSINLNEALLSTNHSPFPDFHLFIVKHKSLKLFFYSIPFEINLTIKTNLFEKDIMIDKQTLVHLHDNEKEIEYIKIVYKKAEIDLGYYFNILKKSEIENCSDHIALT
jgi:hypothetical protein